jgi:hypothetical protein
MNRSRTLSAFGCIVAGVLAASALAAGAEQPGVGPNLRAAGADAAALMNSLHLPPSATPAGGAPFGDDGVLARSPESAILGSPQVIDESAFWTSPRSERAILAFVQADPPNGILTLFNGSGSGAGNNFRFVGYGWPAIPNVLQLRWLTIEVTRLTGGLTGIRADAIVSWIRPRATSDPIPAGTQGLIVRDAAPRGRTHVITSQATIARITALIDGLPLLPPVESFECNLAPPGRVQLIFSAHPNARPLAIADFARSPSGECDQVLLRIAGRRHGVRLLAAWTSGSGLSPFPSFMARLDAALGTKLP